ncbi:MAG: cyclic nucleotide-binding domain-containing protein [Desulfobacter sp.]|nr:cyclic nucleotide-binding domain-containing protein [Desulfobacter sp.]WDP86768.1 MAG: cyclic nucleotide-binding domain-containing protein [Desulfobacter sp.]
MIGIKDLKKINFIKTLPDDILEKIATVAQMETFDEETILIRQDEAKHLIYMLVSGRIFLNCRASGGQALTLDELRPGQTFGVSALLENSPSTYTAICAQECQIITLSSAQMLQLFKTDYAIGYTVMQQVVEKFKTRMNRHTAQFLKSLATHPAIRQA